MKLTGSLPTIWHQDSFKYSVPLQIIAAKNFEWVLQVHNPSHVTRILNYFIQSANDGSPAAIISFQKFTIFLSALILFYLCFKLSKNKLVSTIISVIFFFNPLLVFYENTVMAETNFIFVSLLTCYLFYRFFHTQTLLNASLFGVCLGIFTLTKQSASLFSTVVGAVLLVVAVVKIFSAKGNKFLIYSLLIIFCVQAIRLPFKWITYDKYGVFALQRIKGHGAVIWFLNEEMLRSNPPEENKWLSEMLLAESQKFKKIYGMPLNEDNELAYESAVVSLNVPGREGRFIHPISQKRLSTDEWNSIATKLWYQSILKNPALAAKSYLKNLTDFLFRSNRYFSPYRKSLRKDQEFETFFMTVSPFSLKQKLDPKLGKQAKVVKSLPMDEENLYMSSSKNKKVTGYFPLMVNSNTNYAVLVPEIGWDVQLVKAFKDLSLIIFLLPVFLFSSLIFVTKKLFIKDGELNLVPIFVLCTSLFFLFLPMMIHGEPRYQLQFFHFMLLFSGIVMPKLFEKQA